MAYIDTYAPNAQQTIKALAGIFKSATTADLIVTANSYYAGGGTAAGLYDLLLGAYSTTTGYTDYASTSTNAAFATALITNLCAGTTITAEVQAVWATNVAAALPAFATRGAAMVALMDLINAQTTGDLATLKAVVANRAEVGAFYAQHSTGSTYSSISQLNTAEALVTSDPASVIAQEQALSNPTYALTTSTADLIITTANNDTITGTATTYHAGDRVLDSYTTDNDILNVEYNAATPAATITNIENINMSVANVAVVAVDATNFSGVKNLTVTRTDAVIGGSTIVGNKAVDVNALNGENVLKVTTGAGTTNVDIDQDTKAGVIIDAATATGTMTVEGAATINADNATGAFDINDMGDTTEDAKAITINAAKAASVDTDVLFTGAITINAAAANGAGAINVQNAVGGVTIVAGTTSTADTTITVDNIDASGASITTGTGSSTAANKQISIVLDGTTGTTDAATIAAAGYISLDIDHAAAQNVDVLTLSSATAGTAVTYDIDKPGTGTFTSATITSDVTLQGDESVFSGTTITGDGVINMDTGTAGTIDLSKVAVSNVKVGFDNTANVITVASGAKLDLMSDQTGLDIDFSNSGAGGVLTLVAGDNNGTSTAVPTVSVGAFDAAAGATVTANVNLDVTNSHFTATSTTLGAKQTLVITGAKNVTLGTVTAKAVNASDATGIITATSTTSALTITTGSGADVLTANGAALHSITGGAGNDTINITSTNDSSLFDAGDGDDTMNVDDTSAYVVVGGAGNDTFNTAASLTSVLAGGDGTDTLVIDAAGALDLSGSISFAMSSIEKIDLTAANAALTISAAQFAGNSTVQLIGNAAADTFTVAAATTGSAIDGSNVTVASGSTVTISYTGGAAADTITGGVAAETFTQTTGADVIDGGATGTNTFVAVTSLTESGSANASTGSVVNLSASAVTGVDVYAAIGQYISKNVTDVAAGTVAHVYAGNLTTNSATVTTVGNILNVTGSAGVDYIVGTTGNNVLTGEAGVDYINGGDGHDTITGDASGGTNADILVGGAGNDVFNYFSTADIAAANAFIDSIAGGDNTDEIKITTATGATIADTDVWTRVTSIEKITAGASAGVISISVDDTVTAAGVTTIDLSGDTDATGTNVINLSDDTTASIITSVIGSAGIDQITAAGVAVTIAGGAGVDVLVGGAGVTTVALTYSNAGTEADTITTASFTSNTDLLALSLSALETAGTSGINAAATDFVNLFTGASATAGAMSVFNDAQGGSTDIAANTNMIVKFTGTIASVGALETALEVGGSDAIAGASAAIDANDAFLVAYSDGTDAFLASVVATAGDNGTGGFAATTLTATNLFKIIGDTALVTGDYNNFVFIA